MNLQPADFGSLETLVARKTGLKVDPTRHAEIEQILSAMGGIVGLPTFPALLHMLVNSKATDPLWRQLIDRITIGETYFFRDSAQCGVLQNTVLPNLIAKRRATGFRHLSLWSAGCATGEEPYTLAIMLRELIPDIADWTFAILGTDINLNSLETARKGIYKARSFREETRPDVQARWFQQQGSTYELDPVVRKMVEFTPLNLLSEEYPAFENRTMNLDLIICRNVTIYFEGATTRQIIDRFHGALNSEGWLVVGHAEPLVSGYEGFVPRNFPNAVLYQKESEQPFVLPPPVQAPRVVERLITPPNVLLRLGQPKPEVDEVLLDALKEAQIAAGHENWEAVQKWLAIAEKVNPMNPQVYYLRGLMLMNQLDWEGAFEALRRAIYCDSTFTLAHYTLGEWYERQSDYGEARRCWQRAQRTLNGRLPDDVLAANEDVTVEMFRDFLSYRLSSLPEES